jgi:hypothetical protein
VAATPSLKAEHFAVDVPLSTGEVRVFGANGKPFQDNIEKIDNPYIGKSQQYSAPRPASTPIPARETFFDEYAAQRVSIAFHRAQQASILIAVSTCIRDECDRPCIEHVLEASGGSLSQFGFAFAPGWMGFRGVNVCKADLFAVEIESVAVNHAVLAAAGVTRTEYARCRFKRLHGVHLAGFDPPRDQPAEA